MSSFYRIIRAIVGVIARLLFVFKFEGTQNIPDSGGFILACNHQSAIDPIFLAIACRRQINFMAKQELFANPLLAWLLTKLGVFHVNRGAGDMQAISHALELVDSGEILGIFPEGTRSRDGKLQRAKSGTAYVARMTGCSVMPCAIIRSGKRKVFTGITIRFGELIPNKDLGFAEDSPSSLKKASKIIMAGISQLID